MKATIADNGCLWVSGDTETERFALSVWRKMYAGSEATLKVGDDTCPIPGDTMIGEEPDKAADYGNLGYQTEGYE